MKNLKTVKENAINKMDSYDGNKTYELIIKEAIIETATAIFQQFDRKTGDSFHVNVSGTEYDKIKERWLK